MRATLMLTLGLVLGIQAAVAFEPGEKAVVTKPVEMMTITNSSVSLTPGTTVTVQAIEAAA